MFDGLYPPGDQWYWELTDEAIAANVEFGSTIPTWQSGTHFYPVDGAAGRVANDATAWNWWDAKWGQVIVGVSKDPADKDRITAWARDYWLAMHPHSDGGAYVNMMMDEGRFPREPALSCVRWSCGWQERGDPVWAAAVMGLDQ